MAEIKKYLDTPALGTLVDQIKAEDAKVLAAAKQHTEDTFKLAEVAGAAATAEANAKAYTDELANGQVKLNKEAIEKLNGDATTEGSVAKAVADAKTEMQGAIDAVDAIADKNAEDIAAINNAETGILKQAKDYTDGEVAEVQANVDAVVEKIGEVPEDKTVKEYIDEKTAGIATEGAMTELGNRVTAVEGDVATIKGDYLKASDKEELEGKITEVETAVATEKSRAEGIEAGLESRLAAVEGDYLKGADKEELQGNIDTVSAAVERLTNGVSADEVDGVNDLIQYVKDHGTEVTGMQEDIAQNASDISDVSGRVGTLEGQMTEVQGAVATKVEQETFDELVETVGAKAAASDVTALAGRVDTAEGKITALETADGEQDAKIAALEEKFGEGEGSVSDLIADAVAVETQAREAAIAEVQEDADKGIADAAAALAAAQAAAEQATSLNDAMDVRVKAVEGKAHEHANKAELDLIVSGDKAKWDDAAAKAHEHANKAVLDGITEEKVTLWDGVSAKADKSALDALAETVASNTSAINSFTPITADEVTAMFA